MIVLPELHVGRGVAVGTVTAFPLRSARPPVRGLLTGASAEVVVSELDDGPSVTALT